ncbi:hypothetical protein [Phytoactinopolyspora limicola]|uniref:hypothetical protein n=1 Tax=Phytoactinopolyspora limicola TaxID=2715536 RepID=UPI00140A9220|nr:hypothetical protein [Phytoactinopolyspora limicola]
MTTRLTWSKIANAAYMSVLVLVVVIGPLGLAAVTALRDPGALAVMQSDSMTVIVGAVSGALLLLAFGFGQVRGPAMLDSFAVDVVVQGPRSRRGTLGRPFLVAAGLLTVFVGVLGALPLVILWLEDAVAVRSVVAFTSVSILVGVITSVTWLAGQVVSRRKHAAIVVVGGAVYLVYLLVEPVRPVIAWHWVAAGWPGDDGPGALAFVLLAAVAAAGVVAVPRLLDTIRYRDLREQAQTLSTAGSWALTGDLAGATAVFRAPPAVGRNWRTPRHLPKGARWLWRDVLAMSRNPARLLRGVTSVGGCVLVLAQVDSVPSSIQPALVVLAVVLGYSGMTVFGDGFRLAADSAPRPRLVRYTVGHRLALHSMAPLSVCVVLSAMVAAGTGMSDRLSLPGAALALESVVIILISTAYAAGKGPMPVSLLMPVPTPFGDASALAMFAWQFDGLILSAATVGACVYLFVTTGLGASFVAFVAALLVIGYWARRRYRALSTPG